MKKYLIPIVSVYILLVILSFYIDPNMAIALFKIHTPFLTAIFSYLGLIFTTAGIIILGSLLFIKKKTYIPYMVVGYIITGLIHIPLKFIINRARPFAELSLAKLPDISYDFSLWNTAFPSWHAAAMFFVVPFTFKIKSKLRYVWLVLALLMAFSRMYFGFHYLSDTLAGILIGLGAGFLTLKIYEKKKGF
ncbi:MAG: phosphatase PAP2 family protein [Candidatus Nanoarchaeia archaeon]|nr:phosphatase PAP2 family protein [Candidatus Nanoarchaeia archaeon]